MPPTIVYNKILRAWLIVRGPHQTPIGGRFESRRDALAHLRAREEARESVTRRLRFIVTGR